MILGRVGSKLCRSLTHPSDARLGSQFGQQGPVGWESEHVGQACHLVDRIALVVGEVEKCDVGLCAQVPAGAKVVQHPGQRGIEAIGHTLHERPETR